MIEELENFHKTRKGYLYFGIGELLLVYLFASIAIDTANMFAYAASFILLIGGIMNLTKALRFAPQSPLGQKPARKQGGKATTTNKAKKATRGRSKK